MDALDILVECLAEAGDDVAAGLAAADYILSMESVPEEVKVDSPVLTDPDINAFLAHDIHNRQAQGILNRSLQAAKGLSAAARRDLTAALKRGATDSGEAILKFIDKYRLQLAKLLNTTQLAALLEGAREVAAKVPPLGEVPIEGLPIAEQERIIAASPPVKPPKFTPPPPPAGAPEGVHFPTIDEAVKHLAEKNVIDRQSFDALDAQARAKAFTVANVSAEETLTKIRDSLAANVREGADYETWRKKVLEDVDQGTFLSDAHQETVFRTNVQGAFSDGQAAVLNHPLVRSGFPYSAYDAIHDSRVRKNHLALESLGIGGTNIYRNDDPVFQLFRPPWDYNDRCSWTPITVRHAAERGVREAQEWLETGVEPAEKAFVSMPPFEPPLGFQRALSSAPLSIQLSMQSVTAFSINEGDKPEEETETSLLYGEPEVGGIASATLDTAKEPKRATKVGPKVKKMRVKGKRRPLFKSKRVRGRWTPSVSLATEADGATFAYGVGKFGTGESSHIWHGPTPPSANPRWHQIAPGPQGGKRWVFQHQAPAAIPPTTPMPKAGPIPAPGPISTTPPPAPGPVAPPEPVAPIGGPIPPPAPPPEPIPAPVTAPVAPAPVAPLPPQAPTPPPVTPPAPKQQSATGNGVTDFESGNSDAWGLPVEHCAATLADGTSWRLVGDHPSKMQVPVEMVPKLKDSVYTHNHPNGSAALSAADVKAAVAIDFKEIRAIAQKILPDGTKQRMVMSLTRPEEGWDAKMFQEYKEARDRLFKEFTLGTKHDMSYENELSKALSEIAPKYGATYKRSLVGGASTGAKPTLPVSASGNKPTPQGADPVLRSEAEPTEHYKQTHASATKAAQLLAANQGAATPEHLQALGQAMLTLKPEHIHEIKQALSGGIPAAVKPKVTTGKPTTPASITTSEHVKVHSERLGAMLADANVGKVFPSDAEAAEAVAPLASLPTADQIAIARSLSQDNVTSAKTGKAARDEIARRLTAGRRAKEGAMA